jgi:hypothetical protein
MPAQGNKFDKVSLELFLLFEKLNVTLGEGYQKKPKIVMYYLNANLIIRETCMRVLGRNLLLSRVCTIPAAWGQFHQHSTSSFSVQRSKCAEKTVKLSVSLALSGSAHVEAARKTLVKLTPSVKQT